MSSLASRIGLMPRYAAVAVAGLAFALVVSQAVTLEARYLVAFLGGVVLLSALLSASGSVGDVLLYLLAFNLPFTGIEKGLLITTEPTFVVSALTVGLTDLCLFGLYALWFTNIFVVRSERFPRPTKLDGWVLAFLAAHVVSLLTSASPILTIYEIVRLGKYALAYFYLAHHVQRRHLKWMVAGILFAVLIEGAIGIVQQRTGSLIGIGRTKGDSELTYEQGTVPGFEDVRRAEGTTFDPHTLGLFFAMTLPIPLILALSAETQPLGRVAAAAIVAVGACCLALTFSRASWLAFTGASLFLIWCLARWKRWTSIAQAGVVALILTAAATVPFTDWIHQRLFEAPPELVTTRFETLQAAMQIWLQNPVAGCGANAYLAALQKTFSIFEGDPYFVPAHNMMVMILTELGVIGLVAFLGLSATAIRTGWRIARSSDPLLRCLGAALLAGFLAFQIEGLTDPIYVTNVTYFLLWFELGLTAALYQMSRPLPAFSPVARAREPRAPILVRTGQS